MLVIQTVSSNLCSQLSQLTVTDLGFHTFKLSITNYFFIYVCHLFDGFFYFDLCTRSGLLHFNSMSQLVRVNTRVYMMNIMYFRINCLFTVFIFWFQNKKLFHLVIRIPM